METDWSDAAATQGTPRTAQQPPETKREAWSRCETVDLFLVLCYNSPRKLLFFPSVTG